MRALPLLAPGRAAEYAAASGSNIDMDNYQLVEAGGNQSWAPNPLYTGGGKYRASLGAFYWRNGVVCLAGGAFVTSLGAIQERAKWDNNASLWKGSWKHTRGVTKPHAYNAPIACTAELVHAVRLVPTVIMLANMSEGECSLLPLPYWAPRLSRASIAGACTWPSAQMFECEARGGPPCCRSSSLYCVSLISNRAKLARSKGKWKWVGSAAGGCT